MGYLNVYGYSKRTKLIKGRSLLEHLRDLDVEINASCSGLGQCKQCLVQVDKPSLLSPMADSEREFIRQSGYRLACQAYVVMDDADLFLTVPERRFTILSTGKRKDIKLDPCVIMLPIHGNTVYWNNKELGPYDGELFGISFDIGTTTLSMYCTDLETGEDIIVISRENPQMKYGNDVISRITYAKNHGQKLLERAIRIAANEMINNIPVDPKNIFEIVVVGNPTMRDLFFGIPVEGLGEAPFNPFRKTAIHKTAGDLGLSINPDAIVYGMPLISGFVGADCISVVLATNLHKMDIVGMVVDIGTNTEIVIGDNKRLITTSCASGPAFEGVGIKWGVGGVSGAIKNVSIDEDRQVSYNMIGDLSPIGICGSGLIDVLAGMLDHGIIDWRGRFTDDRNEFIIVEKENPITISESDIDQLKLAKAAISLGIKTLVKKYNLTLEAVDKLYIAGGFGNFINIENAKKIGLLPDIESIRIEKVGNAALEGAREALLSKNRRKEVNYLSKNIEHISLESIQDFSYEYIKELSFKKFSPVLSNS
jgi:uncharacterized 2Fe-2S/4Fe-4S cluster protein (DUF4445 family)